jgi:DNA-binding CsgD family transcriptional regulator
MLIKGAYNLLLLFILVVNFSCSNNKLQNNSIQVKDITIHDVVDENSFSLHSENESDSLLLKNNNAYIVHIKIKNHSLINHWVLDLNNIVTNLSLYYKHKGNVYNKESGVFVPYNKRAISYKKKWLVDFYCKPYSDVTLVLNVYNQYYNNIDLKNLYFYPYQSFVNEKAKGYWFQGVFQSIMFVLFILSIVAYHIYKKKYLKYYLYYLITQSIQFLYYFNITEEYLFFNFPVIDETLEIFRQIGMFAYGMFIVNILKFTSNTLKPSIVKYGKIYFTLNISFYLIIIFIDKGIYLQWGLVTDIFNFIIGVGLMYYTIASKDENIRIIGVGAMIMILGGFFTLLVNFDDISATYPLQIGVLIEFLVFMFAFLRRGYQFELDQKNEQKRKIEIEYKHRLAKLQIKILEKENSMKNQQISSGYSSIIKAKKNVQKHYIRLEEICKIESSEKIQNLREEILNVYSEFESTQHSDYMKEIEDSFYESEFKFYKKLKNIQPLLSEKELRICSLLKLNYSSKDISNVLSKKQNTIDVSRYRLRKKLNLSSGENLSVFLQKIDK